MTRLILPSSSIRPALFCRRPAVSTSTVSTPSSTPCLTASNATLAGSPPSGPRTTSTPTRSPHVASWSTAAARNVSAAPSVTVRSSATRIRAILPTVVVLPAPLTPTTSTTPGLPSAPVTCTRRSMSVPTSSISSSRSTARASGVWPPSTRSRVRSLLDQRLRRRHADVGGEEGVLDRLPRVLVEAVAAEQGQQALAEAALRAGEPLAQPHQPGGRALGLLERSAPRRPAPPCRPPAPAGPRSRRRPRSAAGR